MIGALAFVGALFLLVLVHEYGHFKAARFFGVGVEEFGFGFPPAIVKKLWRGTVYSFNWIPLGGFVRIKGEEQSDTDPDSFSVQPIYKRALIISAGVIMNLIIAVVIFTAGFLIGLPQSLTDGIPAGARVYDVGHRIVGVLPDSPADETLQPGQVITALDGQEFQTLSALQSYIRSKEGKPVEVSLDQAGEINSITLVPEEIAFNNGQSVVGFGVELFTTGTVAYSWYRAPLEAIKITGTTFWLITKTLGEAVVNIIRGVPSSVDIAGPVGIAVITGSVVDLGFIFFLQFVALLSINLAFINLLPFPALDGGRLFFILIEAVRGRPISHKIESRAHQIGFTILLILILVVTYIDFGRLGEYVGG